MPIGKITFCSVFLRVSANHHVLLRVVCCIEMSRDWLDASLSFNFEKYSLAKRSGEVGHRFREHSRDAQITAFLSMRATLKVIDLCFKVQSLIVTFASLVVTHICVRRIVICIPSK